MKRIISVILITTILLLTVAGCTSKKNETISSSSSSFDSSSISSSSESSSNSSNSSSRSEETQKALDEICARGKALYDQKKYSEAIRELKQALDIDNHFVPALELLSVSCNFSGAYDASVKYSDLIIEATPESSNGYYYKGLANKAWKKLDESIKWFNKATEINPKDTWSYYGVATIYADTNKKEPALEYLKKAIDTSPAIVKKTALEQDFHWSDFYGDADFIALTK